jgi:hypothetical protein
MNPGSLVVSVDPRSDWRLAFTAATVGGIFTALFLVIDLNGAGVRIAELGVRVAHLLVFAVIAILLWNRRRRPTRTFCTIATVVIWIPFFPSLWLSEATSAGVGNLGSSWQPFVGHKVLFFGTAAMFPGPAWVGAAMLVALGFHALLLWLHLDLGMARMPVDEPAATIAYLAFACFLFIYRVQHSRIELELARVRGEARALELSTDAFLVVHDLANTPLQVLELALSLLRQRHIGDDAIIAAAMNAIARLRAVRDQLPVSRVTSASPDPDALRRLQSAVTRAEQNRGPPCGP